jgi:hypothetical protein
MKKLLLLLPLFTFIIFYGCEQTSTTEDIPYKTVLVIRGLVEEGKVIKDIYVGKTFPVGLKYNADFTNVKDATVLLQVDDDVIYTLRHTGNGLYTTNNMIARRGNKYTLIVQWGDKTAYGQTSVPQKGSFQSTSINTKQEDGQQMFFLEGRITTYSSEAYGAAWVVLGSGNSVTDESKEFGNILRGTRGGELIIVPTASIPRNFISGSSNIGIHFYIYDGAFYDYYLTQNSNQISDAIFGQPTAAVKWNVTGDAIGMFVARTDTVVKMN